MRNSDAIVDMLTASVRRRQESRLSKDATIGESFFGHHYPLVKEIWTNYSFQIMVVVFAVILLLYTIAGLC